MPQKTTPYENFFTLRPLGGKSAVNSGPVVHNYPYTLYTARFWVKNETPDMKFFEKTSLLTYRNIEAEKRNPNLQKI